MNPDELKLRPATGKDAAVIEELLQLEGLPSSDIDSIIDFMFLAYRDKTLVAMGGIEPAGEYGLLRSVITVPEQRGMGFGVLFCHMLIDKAREMDRRGLYLLTTTADQFFPRLGFEEVDRSTVPSAVTETSEFAKLCPESAVCMYLPL